MGEREIDYLTHEEMQRLCEHRYERIEQLKTALRGWLEYAERMGLRTKLIEQARTALDREPKKRDAAEFSGVQRDDRDQDKMGPGYDFLDRPDRENT